MIKYPREVLEERLNRYKEIVTDKIIELTSDGTDLEKILKSRTVKVYAGHMVSYAREIEQLDKEKGER
jgi:hypothetical protein